MWRHLRTGPIKSLIDILRLFPGFVLHCLQLRPMPLFIEYPRALPLFDKYKFTIKRPLPIRRGLFTSKRSQRCSFPLTFQILAFSK